MPPLERDTAVAMDYPAIYRFGILADSSGKVKSLTQEKSFIAEHTENVEKDKETLSFG